MIALDGTDNRRSKNTQNIANVHKIKDKNSGGFIKAQELTILLLITDKITVPVGFAFYQPDPVLSEWRRKDKELKRQGVAKHERPPAPERDPNYLTVLEIGLTLLNDGS